MMFCLVVSGYKTHRVRTWRLLLVSVYYLAGPTQSTQFPPVTISFTTLSCIMWVNHWIPIGHSWISLFTWCKGVCMNSGLHFNWHLCIYGQATHLVHLNSLHHSMACRSAKHACAVQCKRSTFCVSICMCSYNKSVLDVRFIARNLLNRALGSQAPLWMYTVLMWGVTKE